MADSSLHPVLFIFTIHMRHLHTCVMVRRTKGKEFIKPPLHTSNQVIKDASPYPLTDRTYFLSPATANNGAIYQNCHPMTQASYVPSKQDAQLIQSHFQLIIEGFRADTFVHAFASSLDMYMQSMSYMHCMYMNITGWLKQQQQRHISWVQVSTGT